MVRSATRAAVVSARSVLDGLGQIDLETAGAVLWAARTIDSSSQLRSLLADSSIEAGPKSRIVEELFADRLSPSGLKLVAAAVSAKWSSQEDLIGGLEQLGLRSVASSTGDNADLASELFAIARTVASDANLELALGSKLGIADAKVALVERFLRGKASDQAVLIISHLVRSPRGRRIGAMLRFASSVVADQYGYITATVYTARELGTEQLDRLERALSQKYTHAVKINQVVDARVLGGLRIQIADDVIDGSIASRINDLRLQLAG
jgi:F-type H+-transporting ATPase subunit delta